MVGSTLLQVNLGNSELVSCSSLVSYMSAPTHCHNSDADNYCYNRIVYGLGIGRSRLPLGVASVQASTSQIFVVADIFESVPIPMACLLSKNANRDVVVRFLDGRQFAQDPVPPDCSLRTMATTSDQTPALLREFAFVPQDLPSTADTGEKVAFQPVMGTPWRRMGPDGVTFTWISGG